LKLRLTPLNILTSILLVSVFYLFIGKDDNGWRVLGSISLILLAFLSFFTDLIFRRFVKDLKRIWIIEIVIIIFAAISMALLQK